MFLHLILLLTVILFSTTPLTAEDAPLNRTFHTIDQVKAQGWDTKFTWVRGTILEKVGEDEFVLQDASGTITLFLPEERLYALKLDKGHTIEVWGMVDFGYSNRNKTELYAERIIILKQVSRSNANPAANPATTLGATPTSQPTSQPDFNTTSKREPTFRVQVR